MDDEDECGKPCPYEHQCEACAAYWQRVVDEGLYQPGVGWSAEALRRASQ